MEKGILQISKSKRGKIIVKALIEGKEVTIQHSGITDESLSGKEAEFKREKGLVVQVVCEGKTIFTAEKKAAAPNTSVKKKGTERTFRGKNGNKITIRSGEMVIQHIPNINGKKAKAPYNFIPLNEKVAKAEVIPDFDQYNPDRYTGRIELEIQTSTPLYIRDSLNGDEMEKQSNAKKNGRTYINSDFFSPGGKEKIPGSSLRGMIRTLMEISSYGRFGECDERKLYFRAVADRGSLGMYYKKIMVDESDNHFPKIQAGILEKSGKVYPSKTIKGTQIYRINYDKGSKIIDGTIDITARPFTFMEIFFNPEYPANHNHRMPNGQMHQLKYALVKSVSLTQNEEHPKKGFLISSGEFGRKKHMHWIINDSSYDSSEEIPEDIIRDYHEDVSRKEETDLFTLLETSKRVPCFFVRDDEGKISSFGHTGMFRLAYERSIKDHIPQNLREMEYEISPERLERIRNSCDEKETTKKVIGKLEDLGYRKFTEKEFESKAGNILKEHPEYRAVILKHLGKYDIPEAVFGNAQTFSGRVFFEDAIVRDGQQNIRMKEQIPKLLQSPKPTTFQHYLVQTSDYIKGRKHYNDHDTAIRGNKLYWHKSGTDWMIETDEKKKQNEKIITRIQPVRPGIEFSGCIRFENLSKAELGALLFALHLPEGCAHKLGMGKPLGLGTVKITPRLFLSDRKQRYENLFYEWDDGPLEDKNLSKYKKAFEEYVLQQIGEKGTGLWETERMKELKTMLDVQKGKDLERKDKNDNKNEIRYMEIEGKNKNEFKDRPILPLPSRVGMG